MRLVFEVYIYQTLLSLHVAKHLKFLFLLEFSLFTNIVYACGLRDGQKSSMDAILYLSRLNFIAFSCLLVSPACNIFRFVNRRHIFEFNFCLINSLAIQVFQCSCLKLIPKNSFTLLVHLSRYILLNSLITILLFVFINRK